MYRFHINDMWRYFEYIGLNKKHFFIAVKKNS